MNECEGELVENMGFLHRQEGDTAKTLRFGAWAGCGDTPSHVGADFADQSMTLLKNLIEAACTSKSAFEAELPSTSPADPGTAAYWSLSSAQRTEVWRFYEALAQLKYIL